ncbi:MULTISPECIES: DUF3152 domain-containing protein [Pseudonocardia]|uniref:DUF3152 domain-containing protein n=1 Tax=Pseudonocardia autotrophica TaxID=2074 RepID=A0A1Y2N5L2_PSEAH|nr:MULTISPECIES: DUF3152 domain-containing protein [Pseudonocardia]OSY42755.1 hypothetical protein BG845_00996 [Pseudonocardia autotrophica]TDN77332.1 uncharacterized protein DUF3152 [Pseudonocardia autotrophica]
MPHLIRAGARSARTGTIALLAALTVLAGCGSDSVHDHPGPAPGPPLGEATAAPPEPPASPGPAGPARPALSEADVAAGVRSREVPRSETGELVVVPGADDAPAGRARTVPMRIEIERGVDVDGTTFAGFVSAVLDDPRSWGGDGSVGFARTDGPAPLRIVLATPDLADRLCLPLDTVGRLSCRNGDRVVINLERWVTGTPEYAHDLTAYRRYLVNHEVGHWLGHGHEPCPGPGRPAPVMQQQTLGLKGCTPQPWPR